MDAINTEELDRELDATDEAYIRRKLLTNRYPADCVPYIKGWLNQRDDARREAAAVEERAIKVRTAFWTKVAAVGTVIATAIAMASLFAPKLG